MDAAERAVPLPQVQILPDRATGRQVLREGFPLAACPEHVKDGVQHLTNIHGPRSSPALGRTDQRFNLRPLTIRQIAVVAQPAPIRCPAMLRLPHATPQSKSGGQQGITSDSKDSTSFRIGSKTLYRGRARIEQTMGKLKRFKRIASRCEKTDENYGSFVALALSFILIKSLHTA